MAEFNFSDQAQQLVNSLRRDNPDLSASALVKRAWNASVDPQMAQHVTGVFVVPNTNASEVIVYVDDSIWATEFNLQSEMMRLKLNMQINQDNSLREIPREAEQVEKLIFKVSKDKYIAKERRMTTRQQLEEEEAAYKQAAPVALSEDEQSELFGALQNIDNDAFRDIAYAAAKANLEWQKGIERLGA